MIFSTSKGPNTQPATLPRVSFSDSLTNLGTKLGRVLTNETSSTAAMDELKQGGGAKIRDNGLLISPVCSLPLPCMSNEPTVQERSTSRGREFHSSGRGGAGNIRRSSVSRDAQPVIDGPDDFSATRGREVTVTPKLTHSGRGGAGNIRSPSRDAATVMQTSEREVLAATAERDRDLPQSSGRGGFGNISRSRSRSRAAEDRGRTLHSSGRGGVGNIGPGPTGQDVLEEDERWEHRGTEGVHSTGRGGIANVTATPTPRIDSAPPAHDPQRIHSAGRGGVGNIREASRPRASLERGDDARAHSKDSDRRGLGGMWDRVLSRERKG